MPDEKLTSFRVKLRRLWPGRQPHRGEENRKKMDPVKFARSQGVFFLECRVTTNIRANAKRIWSLLTDAKNFPRWNSTVVSIEGEIQEGARLRLRVPGTARTFSPNVSGIVPNQRMVWTGGFAPLFKGVRTFELNPCDGGSTEFTMNERFSGLMLPLVRGSFPDFGPVFTRYANDLKNEAERTEGR